MVRYTTNMFGYKMDITDFRLFQDVEKENKMVSATTVPDRAASKTNGDIDDDHCPTSAKRQKLFNCYDPAPAIKAENIISGETEKERSNHKCSKHRTYHNRHRNHHHSDRYNSDHRRSNGSYHRRSDHHRNNRKLSSSNHSAHYRSNHDHRHSDRNHRHSNTGQYKLSNSADNSVKLEDIDDINSIKEESLYDDHVNIKDDKNLTDEIMKTLELPHKITFDDGRYCDSPMTIELYKNGEIDTEVFRTSFSPLETKNDDLKNNNCVEKTSTGSTFTTTNADKPEGIHVSVKVEKNSDKSKIEVEIDDKTEKSLLKVAIDVNREDKTKSDVDINLEETNYSNEYGVNIEESNYRSKPGVNIDVSNHRNIPEEKTVETYYHQNNLDIKLKESSYRNKHDNIFSRILHNEPIKQKLHEKIVIDDDELPDLDIDSDDDEIYSKFPLLAKTSPSMKHSRSISTDSSVSICDSVVSTSSSSSFDSSSSCPVEEEKNDVSLMTRMFEHHMCFNSSPTHVPTNKIPVNAQQFGSKYVSAVEACLEEGYDCLDHACLLLLDFTTVSRRPSDDLLRTILTDVLIDSPVEKQSMKMYQSLKQIEQFHPSQSSVPFTFEFIDDCMSNISANQTPSMVKLNNSLALDYCVMSLENELMSRKLMSQRDIMKSVAYQWFNDSTFSNTRKLLSWIPLAISADRRVQTNKSRSKTRCQQISARKRSYNPILLPLILKLLELSVMVSNSPKECADRVARLMVQDMNTWQSADRCELLKRLQSPLLKLSLTRCLLDFVNLDSIGVCIKDQLDEHRDEGEISLIVQSLVESMIRIETGQFDLQLSKRMMKLHNSPEPERLNLQTKESLLKAIEKSVAILDGNTSSVYLQKLKMFHEMLPHL